MSNASANAVFTNDIDIMSDSIDFTINETYTDENALNIRKGLDVDNSNNVNSSEVVNFKEDYLASKKSEYPSYISIDEDNISIEMKSVDIEFKNAVGGINNDKLYVITEIDFGINSAISEGKHRIWVQGHPAIENMKITLPKNVEILSTEGLKNPEQSSMDGRTVVDGQSTTHGNDVGNTTQYEYATILQIYKKPFYEKTSFIISLFAVLLVLIAAASYMIQKNRK